MRLQPHNEHLAVRVALKTRQPGAHELLPDSPVDADGNDYRSGLSHTLDQVLLVMASRIKEGYSEAQLREPPQVSFQALVIQGDGLGRERVVVQPYGDRFNLPN